MNPARLSELRSTINPAYVALNGVGVMSGDDLRAMLARLWVGQGRSQPDSIHFTALLRLHLGAPGRSVGAGMDPSARLRRNVRRLRPRRSANSEESINSGGLDTTQSCAAGGDFPSVSCDKDGFAVTDSRVTARQHLLPRSRLNPLPVGTLVGTAPWTDVSANDQ